MEPNDYQLVRIGLLAAISKRAAELGEEIFDEAEETIDALRERAEAAEARVTALVTLLEITEAALAGSGDAPATGGDDVAGQAEIRRGDAGNVDWPLAYDRLWEAVSGAGCGDSAVEGCGVRRWRGQGA